jgi:hypothetical protein
MSLGWFLIIAFFVAVSLFFWGVYKALKTQKAIYMWAMMPFFIYIIGIFFV